MSTEELLIKALLKIESCHLICKHGYTKCSYPECHKNWCNNHSDFELDIDKLKKEYDVTDVTD